MNLRKNIINFFDNDSAISEISNNVCNSNDWISTMRQFISRIDYRLKRSYYFGFVRVLINFSF